VALINKTDMDFGNVFSSNISNILHQKQLLTDISIYDYVSNPSLGGVRPYPVQAIILKLMSGIELDGKDRRRIKVPDRFNESIKYYFSEKQFLEFAYNEGRCSIKEQCDVDKRWLLLCGRRSGKSFLASRILECKTAQFLYMQDPFKQFGIDYGSPVRAVSVSASREQATIIFNSVSNNVIVNPLFTSFDVQMTKRFAHFMHPIFYEKFGNLSKKLKPNVQIVPMAASSSTGRGFGMICIIFDELGLFPTQRGPASAKEVIKAFSPSLATFGAFGFWLVTSSPSYSNDSELHRLYDISMKPDNDEYVSFRFPTVWMNPNIPATYLKKEFSGNDPIYYKVEFEAEFGKGKGEKWLDDIVVRNMNKREPEYLPKKYFFMGIDLANSMDAAAFSIGHPSTGSKFIEDEHIVLRPGHGRLKNVTLIPNEFLVNIFIGLFQKYKPLYVVTDQHGALSLYSLIGDVGIINRIRDIAFNPKKNDTVNAIFFNYFINNLLRSYNPDLLGSLKALVYERSTTNGFLKVYSGDEEHHPDDSYDAFARSLFAFLLFCQKNKSFLSSLRYDFSKVAFINRYADVLSQELTNMNAVSYSKSKRERYVESMGVIQKSNMLNMTFSGNRISRPGLNKGDVIFRN